MSYERTIKSLDQDLGPGGLLFAWNAVACGGQNRIRKLLRGIRKSLLPVILGFVSVTYAPALELLEFSPEFASPGTVVEAQVAGLDPEDTYTAKIGGLSAPVEEVSSESLKFRLPDDAVTAYVELERGSDGETARSRFAFRVLIPTEVRLDPDLELDSAGSVAASFFELTPLVGGRAEVEVLRGRVTPILAKGGPGDLTYLGVVTDPEAGVQIDITSTVKGLVLLTGLFFTDDPVMAEERLSLIEEMPAYAEAVSLAENSLNRGANFLQDPQFTDLLGEIVVQLMDRFAQDARAITETTAAAANSQQDRPRRDDFVNAIFDFAGDNPRDLPEPEGFGLFNALNVKAEELGVSPGGLPVRRISFAPPKDEESGIQRPNPVDWLAKVYELDPDQFPFGKLQVNTLEDDYETVFERIKSEPIDSLFIPAPGGATEFIKILTPAGLVDAGTKFLQDALFPPEKQDTKLEIPLNRPGIYIVRTFSGSLFTPQNELIANLPNGSRDKIAMLAINGTKILLDGSAAFLGGVDAFANAKAAEIAFETYKESLTALEQKELEGGITSEDFIILLRELSRAFAKNVAGKSIELLGNQISGFVGEGISTFLRIQGAMLSAAQSDERFRAIVAGEDLPGFQNPFAIQTVETTIIMVGDPFAPAITRFEPRSGYRGQVVTLHGHGFSPVATDNLVEFNAAPTTSPDQPPAAPAEVIFAAENRLVVTVPENAEIGTGPIRVQVRVEGSDDQIRGVGDTSPLTEPYDTFTVIGDPKITGIEPSTILVGTPFRILGENLPSALGRLGVLTVVDGELDINLQVLRAVSPNEILVRAPTFATERDLRIRVFHELSNIERTSEDFPLTVVAGTGEEGWSMIVNSTADTVAADDFLTLREAMILASGSGSIHPLTFNEELQISTGSPQRPVGEGVADVIEVPTSLEGRFRDDPPFLEPGTPISLTDSLPPLTGPDSLFLHVRPLEGAAVDGDGLVVTGQGMTLDGLFLSDVGGNGVVFDGAKSGRFVGVIVENAGKNGLLLRNGSANNDFETVTADQCGENGVHLTGPGVANNHFTLKIDVTTNAILPGSTSGNPGWGIRVDGGANGNTLEIGDAIGNTLGGIGILDSASVNNAIGRQEKIGGVSPFLRIMDNSGGPGVRTEASGTRIRWVRAAGNGGDGIIVEGAIENCGVDTVEVGFDIDGAAKPNNGSGIHFKNGVSNSRIGVDTLGNFNRPPRSLVGGNDQHGVFLENVSDIRVNYINIGIGRAGRLDNGIDGIRLLNASGCRIGDHRVFYDVGVIGAPNGAGIRMEGLDTFDNAVFGSSIGATSTFLPNGVSYFSYGDSQQIGIYITDGAWGNVIGRRGDTRDDGFGLFEPTEIFDPVSGDLAEAYTSGIRVYGSTEAGIIIESGGDPRISITPDDVPVGGNVVQNCEIGFPGVLFGGETKPRKNRVGLILRGEARANRIGGTLPSEGNQFWGNRSVGLIIDGIEISQSNRANRIVGNVFRQNWETLKRLDRPPDFSTEPPVGGTGLGLLVRDSVRQPIGGTAPGERNVFSQTGTGIYVQNSVGIVIAGNRIGTDSSSRSFLGNTAAGLVLNQCRDCVVGPANFVLGNGNAFEPVLPGSAGIAVFGGETNRIIGNFVGRTPDGSEIEENRSGIVLVDTLRTQVGGVALANANHVVANEASGIILRGDRSALNLVGGNIIGYIPDPASGPLGIPAPNGTTGILLTDGASDNRIGLAKPTSGGSPVPAGNRIYHNSAAGIRVEGGSTLRNRLLFNSISSNGGPGIETTAGGNRELTPPEIIQFANGRVWGQVADQTTNDYLVQIYTDTADEGRIYKNQGTVENGLFSIPVGGFFYPNLTATVTDLNGNTSAFGGEVEYKAALELSRFSQDTLERGVSPGSTGVIAGRYLAFARNATIEVKSVRFRAAGDLSDVIGVDAVKLYLDADRDGLLSDRDPLLGGPQTFLEDDGAVLLNLEGAVINAQSVQHWILVINLADLAPVDASVSFRIEGGTDVTADTVFPQGIPHEILGPFPLESDTVALIGPDDPLLEPASIEDPLLRQAVAHTLGLEPEAPVTRAAFSTVTRLTAKNAGITTLAGLESASKLRELNLGGNALTDISPLRKLSSLNVLRLNNNLIEDLSPLIAGGEMNQQIASTSLSTLEILDLSGNRIVQIDPLSGLSTLVQLHLGRNAIEDLSALSGLNQLAFLDLHANLISRLDTLQSLTQLQQIRLDQNRLTDIAPLSDLVNLRDDAVLPGAGLDLRFNRLDLTPGAGPLAVIDGLRQIPGLTIRTSGQVNLAFDPSATWPEARKLVDGWYFSPRFGMFNVTFANWIYHRIHGWMFLAETESPSGELWLYHGPYGWLWTNLDLGGWFFSRLRSDFIFFQETGDGVRFLFDRSTQSWEPAPPFR